MTKTTKKPENWGNYIFPEGMTSLNEVYEWLDEVCDNGHYSRWTEFGHSVLIECEKQLFDQLD